MPWVKQLKRVFYFELVLNTLSIIQCFFMPSMLVEGFGAPPSPLVNSLMMWFGSIVLVITYIMGRVLLAGNDKALRVVLEGYAIGDVVYLVGLFAFIGAIGGVWTAISIFTVVITLVLLTVRIVYLWGTRAA